MSTSCSRKPDANDPSRLESIPRAAASTAALLFALTRFDAFLSAGSTRDQSWGRSLLEKAVVHSWCLRGSRACGKPDVPVSCWWKAEMSYLLVFIGGGL